MAKLLVIDIYDITEARAEAAVTLLRKIKRDVEGAIACVGRQDGIDLAVITDALTLCSSVSLSITCPIPLAKRPKAAAEAEQPKVETQAEETAMPRCYFCGRAGVPGPAADDMWRCKNPECFRSTAGDFTRPVFEGGVQ